MLDRVAPLSAEKMANMTVVAASERLGFHTPLEIFHTSINSAMMSAQMPHRLP